MDIKDRIERLKAAKTLMDCGTWLTVHATKLTDWAIDPNEGWTLTFTLGGGETKPRFVAKSGNRSYFGGNPVGLMQDLMGKSLKEGSE